MTFKTMLKKLTTLGILSINNLAISQETASSREIKFAGRPNGNGYQEVCHIRFTGRYGQCGNGQCSFLPENLKEKFGQDVPLGIDCISSKDLDFPKGTNVRFNATTKEWMKDFTERSYADNAERYRELEDASRVYTIEAKNSNGYVYTEDDLMGDESRRYRVMHFCLLHPPKALCGSGDIMLLSEPESDLLPYAIEILKTIEFIDDDSVQPSNPLPVQEKSIP